MINLSVTCIIPTFNRAVFLKEAIESILSQTFTDWELIIVDNGSTDNTPEIVNEYRKKDERVLYYRYDKKGPAAARNFGASMAKGRFLVFLDDDDISLPYRFEKQLEAIKKSGKEFVVSGYEVRIRSDNRLIAKRINELKGFGAGFPSRWIISKTLFDKCNGFDEELLTMEDPEFSYRVAQHEIFACHADVVTIMYPSIDSISSEGKTLAGKVQMMEKSAHLMHHAEAAWWYYNIARAYYLLGAFNETRRYLKLALASDKNVYYKVAQVYFNLTRLMSGSDIIRKINLKIFSFLGKCKVLNLIEHPVVI